MPPGAQGQNTIHRKPVETCLVPVCVVLPSLLGVFFSVAGRMLCTVVFVTCGVARCAVSWCSVRAPPYSPPSEGGMKLGWHPQSCGTGATLWHAVSFFFFVWAYVNMREELFLLFKTKKTESCLVRRNFPQLREPPHTLHLSSPDIPRCKDAPPSSDNFHHKSPRKYKSFQISSQILSQTTKSMDEAASLWSHSCYSCRTPPFMIGKSSK